MYEKDAGALLNAPWLANSFKLLNIYPIRNECNFAVKENDASSSKINLNLHAPYKWGRILKVLESAGFHCEIHLQRRLPEI